MTARIVGFEVLKVQFPFRISFGHALASRKSSTNVIVRARTEGGVVGFGECVPRDYVTGETPEGAQAFIAERLAPGLIGLEVATFEEIPERLEAVFGGVVTAEPWGAARCAAELAVLDAFGHAFGRSVGDLLGPIVRPRIAYSGVLPLLPAPLMAIGALAHRALGIGTLKLKVGRSVREDLRNLRILRRALGSSADLRVDANCAWQPDEAVAAIRSMERYRIQAVEQPVPKDDFAGLKRVADAVATPVMADESLCTLDDGCRLADGRMVDMFNIRISKCGGLLSARRLAEIAERAGLTCQMGAHPGESAILAAAGRQFAARTPSLRYFETSPGGILLKQDIATRGIGPGRGGLAPALTGPGLGVEIDEARLAPFIMARTQVA